MRIFISWSGQRSQALAQALHEWLPLVLHYVQPWLSQSDIAAGERWGTEVAKELEGSNFGIICVTRENVSAPWILFEAGALAKLMQEGRVIPLLLDIDFKDISGPLAQFQAKKVEKAGLNDVIVSINRIATQPVLEDRAARLFESLWPEFEKRTASIPKPTAPTKPNRPQHEVLEELVASVRGLDVRLRDDDEPRVRRRRRPFLLHELLRTLDDRERPSPIATLIFASSIRDEIPFLYELGMELYRAPPRSNQHRILQQRFDTAVKLLQTEKFPDDAFSDPRLMAFIARRLQESEPPEFDLSERERRRPTNIQSNVETEREEKK
ncbi:toll/interleukin-1 receptor domain-containing protein [Bradyrhizobium sp. SZCCHNS2096]|uniref:toll/interleukin-1 receptor domain-containing protein n=1 Tax=Bradyrhizobium sp. SZCCHNS2096 TaxID=3057309 RepID=UPI00291692D0|nr:toll/interleukin-1 receptor domain-containing protein [Bradyrhizobium sp. SZCCHNS2096]